MEDKIPQARSELFEAWTKSEHGDLTRRQDGEYFDDLTHGAWLGFNAALDLAVIKLPPAFDDVHNYACYQGGWNDMRGEAVDAIESAPATAQGVNQQLLAEYHDEMANGEKMANCNTDCRSAEGVTVGLIDGLITIARVLTLRDLSPAAVQEALIDLRSDEDLARVLGPAIRKGVNANTCDLVKEQLLEALEALEEAARQVMAGEMAPSSIMVERMKSRAAIESTKLGIKVK